MKFRVHIDGTIYSAQRYGGVSRYLSSLLSRFQVLEPDLEICLVTGSHVHQALPVKDRVEVVEIRLRSFRWRPERTWKFARADVNEWLLRHDLNAASRRLGTKGLWHSPYYRVPEGWRGPVVVTALDLAYFLFPDIFRSRKSRLLARRQLACYHRGEIVLAISNSTKRDLVEVLGIPKEKIRVTQLAPTPGIELRQPIGAATSPFILSVGNRSPIKNIPVLIEAFSRWSRNRDLELVLVGPRATASEVDLIAELDLTGRVRFVGGVDDSALTRLYAAAEAFVYPSLYEGFGIPLLEAMQCGCPVIASDIPSSREVAGDAASYFVASEPDSLVAVLETVLDGGRHASRVSDGLERVRQFSWDRSAQETLAAYNEVSN